MSETAPDLGTAWRLLDEARAERDAAYERTAELVSEVNRVTAEQDRMRALVRQALEDAGVPDDVQAEWLERAGIEPEPAIMGAGVEYLLDGA